MLKKSITYTNFNDEEITEDFFFHLSKAELVELEMSHDGGLSEALKKIVAAEDNKQLIIEFKKIILTAYGKKSEDGKRFIKSQELRDEFESSEAYSALFMELITDADAASSFVNGIVPRGMVEETMAEIPQPKVEPVKMTMGEVRELPAEEYMALSRRVANGEVIIVEEKMSS